MISPEEYFQKYLKDKNEKEILKQIHIFNNLKYEL